MAIKVGDRLPEFAGKRVVLFAVPGAFTPTCHLKHLPSFIDSADGRASSGWYASP